MEFEEAYKEETPQPPEKSRNDQWLDGWVQLACVVAFVIVSIAASALLKKANEKEVTAATHQERILYVQAQSLTRSDYRIAIATPGLITPSGKVDLAPQVSGQLTAVADFARTGGRFSKGDILFQIDPADYEYALKQARASVVSAKTALELEKAEYEAARAEWKLFHGDKAIPALAGRGPQLAEAKAALASAKAALADAQLDLERTAFIAPFDGRVIEGDLAKGQYVSAGQSYGTLYAPAELEIEIALDQDDLQALQATDEAVIHVGTPQGDFPAHVKRIAASLDETTRFGTVTLGLDLPEAADENNEETTPPALPVFLPGTLAQVTMQTQLLPDVFIVPIRALQKDGHLWVIEDGKLTALDFTTVHKSGAHIIIESALDGFTVMTSQMAGAAEGMRVEAKLSNEDEK